MIGNLPATERSSGTLDFISNVRTFENLLDKYRFALPKTRMASIEFFESLALAERERIAKNFSSYAQLIVSAETEGVNLRSDNHLLKFSAKKLGIYFSDEVYNLTFESDIIEIYDLNFVQIYRNLALFDICGYSITDLLTHQFYELYERSEKVNEQLIEAATKVMTRNFDLSPLSMAHVQKHLMRERFSELKVTSEVQFKYLFPVYQWPQKLSGLMTIQTARPIPEVEEHISFI